MLKCYKKVLLSIFAFIGLLYFTVGNLLWVLVGSGVFVVFLIFVVVFDRRIKILKYMSSLALILSALLVLSIFSSVVFQSVDFFLRYPIFDFVFGSVWNPSYVNKSGEVGVFGILPLLSGTLLISAVALVISLPIALFSSLYLSEYASRKNRKFFSAVIEVFSGVPTIVYGYFALTVIYPNLRNVADFLGFVMESENALLAGMTVGFMMMPSTISLMYEGLKGVPKVMRYGSFAMGATKSETVFRVILPTAFPTLFCASLLSVSRAIGETMIVLMTAGVASRFSFNPLESVTTITIQIVTLLTGESDYASLKTLAAYALTLFLFLFTFTLNILASWLIKKYNKKLIYA